MLNSLFLTVFNNKYLFDIIFKHVSIICGRNNKTMVDGVVKHFKWVDLVDSHKLLATYNYLDLLTQWFERESNLRSDRLRLLTPWRYNHEFLSFMKLVVRHGSVEMLEYIIGYFKLDRIGIDNTDNHNKHHGRTPSQSQENISGTDPEWIPLNSILRMTSKYNRLDMIEHLLHSCNSGSLADKWDYHSAMLVAPRSGSMHILEFFMDCVENEPVAGKTVLDYAAGVGSIEMLEYLCAARPADIEKSNLFLYAVDRGHESMVRYLLTHYPDLKNKLLRPVDKTPLDMAIQTTHNGITRLLLANGCRATYPNPLEVVAFTGNVDLIQLLHDDGSFPRAPISLNVVSSLEMIQWLVAHGYELTANTHAMDFAASKGRLDVVRYLHENRTEGCTTHAINMAVQSGNLDLLKYLHENRTEGGTARATMYAAATGNLAMVKFFHANRTEPFDHEAMDMAANKGHLDVVKFLHENRTEGCSTHAMDEIEIARIGSKKALEMICWLHENRTEGCTDSFVINNILNSSHTDMDIIKWVYEYKPELSQHLNNMESYFKYNNYLILEWLLETYEIPLMTLYDSSVFFKSCYPYSIQSGQLLKNHINQVSKTASENNPIIHRLRGCTTN